MIGGGIDISVGAVTGLVTMCCAVFLESGTGNVGGSMLLALGIGVGFGLLQGFLISYLEIQPFIITLAGMFLANGLLTTIHKDPLNVTVPAFVSLRDLEIVVPWLGTSNRLGNFIPLEIKPGAVVVLILVALLVALMKWSRFGRNLYAVGGNNQSALMLGINVKRTKFYSYVLCGSLSGIAGFVFIMTTGAGNVGNAAGFEMKAIAASIIGGTMLTGGCGAVDRPGSVPTTPAGGTAPAPAPPTTVAVSRRAVPKPCSAGQGRLVPFRTRRHPWKP
jgi:simple sugar transport system permease protein